MGFNEIRGCRKRFINYKQILAETTEELIFLEFFGHYPDLRKRYLSPFRRDDKKAGCRFTRKNGILYFVDNAGYNGKVFFNCFDFVKALYSCDFREACILISNRMNVCNTDSYLLSDTRPSLIKQEIIDDYTPTIKFRYKRWREPHYFSQFDIDSTYLNLQPYYNVSSYWCNSRSDLTIRKNKFGYFKYCIAYFFEENDHTKLYFPDNYNSNLPRFYSSCTNEDVFGWHRMGDYVFGDKDHLLITKSGKDELIANYHGEFNSIGLQSEGIKDIPDKLLRVLKYFNVVYIWMDADRVGINFSRWLKRYLKRSYPKKEILCIMHREDLGNDITNIWENGYDLVEVLKNSIE